MVKQSLEIYKRDLKTIFTNYAVLITIIGLCILPSLYAWINIKASWDPYSQQATSRIKVAVVNNDAGATLNGKQINVGEEVVKGLEENKLLGWRFLDEQTAMQDLEEGKIYAAIIIPSNFSDSLTSIITNNIRKAQIKYIVNEKLNAIAPKITDKGATGIQTTVSQEVVETVSNIVLSKAKELGIELEDKVLPKLIEVGEALNKLPGKVDEISQFIDETQGGMKQYEDFINQLVNDMPQMETFLTDAQNMIDSMQSFISDAGTGMDTLAPTIKKDLGLVSEISGELYTELESLESFIQAGSDKAPEIVSSLLTKIDGLNQLTESMLKILNAINKLSDNKGNLDTTISNLQGIQDSMGNIKGLLEGIQERLANGEEIDLTQLENTKTVLEDVSNITSGLYDRFDTDIIGRIDDILGQVDTVLGESGDLLSQAEESLPEILNLLNTAEDLLQKGDSGLEEVQSVMPTIKEKITTLANRVNQINENKQLKDFLDLLKEDVVERAQFLADSTSIVNETIFPMGNYGSQMAPFYSVLASWVGLTILVSILSVAAKGEYKSVEVYFGKLLLYMTISLVQGIIIALGDLYLLKIYCLRPWLFILGMIYISITFTFIVYSLVSVFGNIGKVVAIILLILQVAGAGGTFPVQLTSNFFITINPFLPFTYAISFLRESIGGITRSVFLKDIFILACFILGCLIIAILFKKPINKVLKGFIDKYEEGEL